MAATEGVQNFVYSCEGVADLTSDFGFLKQLAKVAQSIAAEHMATAR